MLKYSTCVTRYIARQGSSVQLREHNPSLYDRQAGMCKYESKNTITFLTVLFINIDFMWTARVLWFAKVEDAPQHRM